MPPTDVNQALNFRGGQDGCKRIIEVFVKKKIGAGGGGGVRVDVNRSVRVWGGVRVDVNEELKIL